MKFSAFAGAGMLLMSSGAALAAHGARKQLTDGLVLDMRALEDRVAAVEALKISVETLGAGIDNLSQRMVDNQKLNDTQMARLGDQLAAGQRLTDSRFAALKELATRDLDEVKSGLRAIRQTLDAAAVRPMRVRAPGRAQAAE